MDGTKLIDRYKMELFRFASPLYFLLLIPLFICGIVDFFRRRSSSSAVIFSTTSELDQVPLSAAAYVKKFLPVLFYSGAILLIAALARPQEGVRESKIVGNGISIVMCVDRSGSMAAEDFQLEGIPVNRLKAVKNVFKEFVSGSKDFRGRPNDLIALITFGGFVDSCCPLTMDHNSLLELLEKIETPVPLFDRNGRPIRTEVLEEESGTAIGDALATAVDLIKESTNKTKIVVLLSDGMQTAGVLSPEDGINIANTYGIKVYTIGVGTNDYVPFPQYLPTGQTIMTKQLLEFDPATLQTIAQATGGRYFHAEDVDTLKDVYEEIDRLERTKFDGGSYAQYRDVYYPFAILGIILLTSFAVLTSTRFRTFP